MPTPPNSHPPPPPLRSVIFLDEPTSGLDSTTALKLMHTMRSLAQGGRTIIASIHQPSSRLYQQVNKVRKQGKGGLGQLGMLGASHHAAEIQDSPCPPRAPPVGCAACAVAGT